MSRGEQSGFPAFDKNKIRPEQSLLLTKGIEFAEKILGDDDLCAWIREKFVQDKMTQEEVLQEFLGSDWVRLLYNEAEKYPNMAAVALRRLRYELLTPDEIIDLNKEKSRRTVEIMIAAKGHIRWNSELLQIFREILNDPLAWRDTLDWEYIAKEFSLVTGAPVTKGQIKQRWRYIRIGVKPNLKKGIWTPENVQLLLRLGRDPKAQRRIINWPYVIGKFADLTGKSVTIEAMIRAYHVRFKKEFPVDKSVLSSDEELGEEAMPDDT